MKELGITKGPYEVCEHNWSDTSFYGNGEVICTQSIYDEATEETQEELESQVSRNFNLIEDTFNTAQKTNLLPSELLERYNEAMEALKELVSIVKIHSKATKNNFAWAELEEAEKVISKQ